MLSEELSEVEAAVEGIASEKDWADEEEEGFMVPKPNSSTLAVASFSATNVRILCENDGATLNRFFFCLHNSLPTANGYGFRHFRTLQKSAVTVFDYEKPCSQPRLRFFPGTEPLQPCSHMNFVLGMLIYMNSSSGTMSPYRFLYSQSSLCQPKCFSLRVDRTALSWHNKNVGNSYILSERRVKQWCSNYSLSSLSF